MFKLYGTSIVAQVYQRCFQLTPPKEERGDPLTPPESAKKRPRLELPCPADQEVEEELSVEDETMLQAMANNK